MQRRLSFILCSRNDAYMGNSRWRLETTLNYLAERVRALGRADDVEIVVTDWGSAVPLHDAVQLSEAARRLVTFVTVPAALAVEKQGDSPFPEVLALNAAARRARGQYIGRLDQDTLVGERFLQWFFDTVDHRRPLAAGVMPARALFFSNRRDIPYRVGVRSPTLRNVTAFIRLFGTALPIWRENSATGDLFWTSNVGLWLAHRDLWDECGGYDERLVYYNWMETDMICRLRQKYPVVDLGGLTGHAFYHLEHVHPRTALLSQRHAIKNTTVDVANRCRVMHPNDQGWGLQRDMLTLDPARTRRPDDAPESLLLMLLRLLSDMTLDRAALCCLIRRQRWRRRYRRAREELRGTPVSSWGGTLSRLWAGRSDRQVRRLASTSSRREPIPGDRE